MLTSRCYESEHDLRQMQDLLMAARAATDDWRYPHIGVATFRFFMVASHFSPYEFVRLWHDRRRVFLRHPFGSVSGPTLSRRGILKITAAVGVGESFGLPPRFYSC
jgi:hypothetical protein